MRGQGGCSCVLVGVSSSLSFLLVGERWRGVFIGINHVVSDGRGIGWRCEDVYGVQCFACRIRWWCIPKEF